MSYCPYEIESLDSIACTVYPASNVLVNDTAFLPMNISKNSTIELPLSPHHSTHNNSPLPQHTKIPISACAASETSARLILLLRQIPSSHRFSEQKSHSSVASCPIVFEGHQPHLFPIEKNFHLTHFFHNCALLYNCRLSNGLCMASVRLFSTVTGTRAMLLNNLHVECHRLQHEEIRHHNLIIQFYRHATLRFCHLFTKCRSLPLSSSYSVTAVSTITLSAVAAHTSASGSFLFKCSFRFTDPLLSMAALSISRVFLTYLRPRNFPRLVRDVSLCSQNTKPAGDTHWVSLQQNRAFDTIVVK